jgi:PAS domain S-box-containing protein
MGFAQRGDEAHRRSLLQEIRRYRGELDQARAYLQCILQNASDIIFTADVEGMLVSVNRGGERILGYSLADVAGMRASQLASDPEAFEALMAAAQRDGGAAGPDIPFRRKNGGVVYCNVSLTRLVNRSGLGVGSVGICQDITVWKRVQEELVRIDRLAGIGRLAAGIAHEVNNPLAVIQEVAGWAGGVIRRAGALQEGDRLELAKAMEEVEGQVARCRTITHQLLGFVRESLPQKAPMEVRDLLASCLTLVRPALKGSAVEIVVDVPEHGLEVCSDRKMLEQVLVNLLTNAIDAVREKRDSGGRITVRARRIEGFLEIEVTDDGTGIAPDNREKVFDLLFTTKAPGKGTGLGLPICHNIVKNLGGDIRLDTELGVGTTLTVRVPVT